MNLIIQWLFYSCRFGHKWNNKDGGLNAIRSADRGLPGEILFKNPDGGWLRYRRYCKRCDHAQYLNKDKSEWTDMP